MNEYAIVNKPIASIYSENKKGVITDEALHGMRVKILDKNKKFAKIQTDYNYMGFVKNSNLTYENSENKYAINMYNTNYEVTNKFIVTAPFVDVLNKAEMQSTIIKTIPRGSIICKNNNYNDYVQNDWVNVVLPNGKTGYAKSSHIKFMPVKAAQLHNITKKQQQELREKICDSALSYLGTQYRWGGKTPLGIDCSGLTFMAYMLNGIYIYRDAKIKKGFAVKQILSSKIKKADLLFFHGHVAMYLGKGNFIHSTAFCHQQGVVISSLCKNKSNFRKDLKHSFIAAGSVFEN